MTQRTPPPIRETMFMQPGVLSKIWIKFFNNLYAVSASSDMDVNQAMQAEGGQVSAAQIEEIERILTMLPGEARDFMALIADLERRLIMVSEGRDFSRQIADLEMVMEASTRSDHGYSGILDESVWDDLRVVPGSFDRPGASDPTIVVYAVGGGGTNGYLYQFADGNIASFTIQLPHAYKQGSDIYAHIHWTPGPRGAAESGKLVGWKIDYSWANIDGAFGAMATLDLQDACNGVDHEHNMTPEVVIDGHTARKDISSMLICNVKRTDTGADDTWAGTLSGERPMLLEIDFHYQIDAAGSHLISQK